MGLSVAQNAGLRQRIASAIVSLDIIVRSIGNKIFLDSIVSDFLLKIQILFGFPHQYLYGQNIDPGLFISQNSLAQRL